MGLGDVLEGSVLFNLVAIGFFALRFLPHFDFSPIRVTDRPNK